MSYWNMENLTHTWSILEVWSLQIEKYNQIFPQIWLYSPQTLWVSGPPQPRGLQSELGFCSLMRFSWGTNTNGGMSAKCECYQALPPPYCGPLFPDLLPLSGLCHCSYQLHSIILSKYWWRWNCLQMWVCLCLGPACCPPPSSLLGAGWLTALCWVSDRRRWWGSRGRCDSCSGWVCGWVGEWVLEPRVPARSSPVRAASLRFAGGCTSAC